MTRILGIDYGVKRIGLALSDALGITAQPLDVIERKSTKIDIEAIRSLIKDKEVTRAVIGLPLNMDGSPGMLTGEVTSFAKALEETLGLPVELFDERLTTAQVERMLLEEADLSRTKRKGVRDKLAASLILQSYLDRKSGG